MVEPLNVLRYLKNAFASALCDFAPDSAAYADLVKPAQDPKFGDYQANCAMPLGKQLRRNPREVARELVYRLDLGSMTGTPEIAGPGFINLRLSDEWLAASMRQLAGDDRLGVAVTSTPKTFVIDFSSPNVAKPMHVGHIRSTIIGDSLTRLLRFLGHRVIADNHVGDWGTQFGMLIFGYKHLLDERAYSELPVNELARLYKVVNCLSDAGELAVRLQKRPNADDPIRQQMLSKWSAFESELQSLTSRDPKLARLAAGFPSAQALAQYVADQSREQTVRLHVGDPANRALWQQFMPHCLAELDRMYQRLDIHFDHHHGESFYDPMLPAVVEDLLARHIAEESDGAVCVFLDPERQQPPCLIRKRDGAFLYATSDLATVKYRAQQFHSDAMLYVVDQRQSLHFQQFFEVARRWGYSEIDFVHVSFGTILGSDGRPFKTREGGTVGLGPLLDEAVERARCIVDQNSQELSNDARQHVAEAVGIGAIKYADLSVNRTSDYTFNWDKMMAMQGNTATYLQYAYARIQSIFRKGQVDPAALRGDPPAVSLTEPAERSLAVSLLRLPETLDEAAADHRPSMIAAYLYALAESFSAFFRDCPVLKADSPTLRASRLLLCDLTGRTMQKGLELLGIRTIDQM